MRRVRYAAFVGLVLFMAVGTARAQSVEDEMDQVLGADEKASPKPATPEPGAEASATPPTGSASDAPSGAKPPAQDLPQIGEDQLAVFVLNRGFYCTGDLGIFMTLGGVRGYSNVQPYVTLKGGFDINDYLSVQVALATGFSSGNALSQNDAPGAGGNEVEDYGLFLVGGEVVGALRPTARFAIEPRLGGGIARIYPQPTAPGNLNASVPGIAPQVGGGVDLKYLTLLTDFSAGVSFGGYFVIGPNIPAVSAAGTVRYTF